MAFVNVDSLAHMAGQVSPPSLITLFIHATKPSEYSEIVRVSAISVILICLSSLSAVYSCRAVYRHFARQVYYRRRTTETKWHTGITEIALAEIGVY